MIEKSVLNFIRRDSRAIRIIIGDKDNSIQGQKLFIIWIVIETEICNSKYDHSIRAIYQIRILHPLFSFYLGFFRRISYIMMLVWCRFLVGEHTYARAHRVLPGPLKNLNRHTNICVVNTFFQKRKSLLLWSEFCAEKVYTTKSSKRRHKSLCQSLIYFAVFDSNNRKSNSI
jgi:hypothetical protein